MASRTAPLPAPPLEAPPEPPTADASLRDGGAGGSASAHAVVADDDDTKPAPVVVEVDGVWPTVCDADAAPVSGTKRRRRNDSGSGSGSGSGSEVVYNGVRVPRGYWVQRSALWHRFRSAVATDGSLVGHIAMDAEGWYSVTPEALALHIAACLLRDAPAASNAVLELCCGVGGNTVAFLRHPHTAAVLAVDTDATRLAMVGVNAAVYNGGTPVTGGWPHERAAATAAAAAAAAVTATPNLVLMCASADAVLRRMETLLLAAPHDVPPPAAPAAGAGAGAGVVTVDHIIAATAGGAGDGVTLTLRCPSACCTRVLQLRVGFCAPPWGGPPYDAGAATFDVASLTLGTAAYGDVARRLAALVPVSAHYLPRNADAAGTRSLLSLPGASVACTLLRLAGRRRATALLAVVTRAGAP